MGTIHASSQYARLYPKLNRIYYRKKIKRLLNVEGLPLKRTIPTRLIKLVQMRTRLGNWKTVQERRISDRGEQICESLRLDSYASWHNITI